MQKQGPSAARRGHMGFVKITRRQSRGLVMTAGLGVIEVTEEGGELLENTQRPVERWSPEANWIGG